MIFGSRFKPPRSNPLIKVENLQRPRLSSLDNAVLFFAMMAFVPVFFFGSVYSQAVLDYNASNAGLIYPLVFFAGFAPAVRVGGRILDNRGGPRPSHRRLCGRRGWLLPLGRQVD